MELNNLRNEIKSELYAVKSEILGALNTINSDNKSFSEQLNAELTSVENKTTETNTELDNSDSLNEIINNLSSGDTEGAITNLLNQFKESQGIQGNDNTIIFANNVYQTYNNLNDEAFGNKTEQVEVSTKTSEPSLDKVENTNANENNSVATSTPTTSKESSTDNNVSKSTSNSLEAQVRDLNPSSIGKVSAPIQKAVSEASAKYDIPEKLILKVIETESSFNNSVVSSSGAVGLMQLMPATAKYLGVSNSKNIEQNIEGGTKYLRKMLDKYDGNLKLALAAYNAGPGNVDKYNGVPPFKETQNYVKKILI